MSLKIFVVVASVIAVAVGELPPQVYPETPQYHSPPSYHAPVANYPDAPPQYTYNYGVADGYTGVNFGHNEARDGYKTQGSYSVDLPDGRKQTVNYVDNGDGLEAQVTYEGEAQYPEHKPSYPAPQPYNPQPYNPQPYNPPPPPTYA